MPGSNKRRVNRAEFKINAPGVYSGYRRLFEVPAFIRDGYIKSGLCHNCILVLFLPFYLNLYTDI